jgi:hypothetical protein
MALEAKPVGVEHFHHEGRGPELRQAHWGNRGGRLLAIDYFNPEAEYTPENLRHVRFINGQVVMITPEEVIAPGTQGDLLVRYRPAAAFECGRDAWLVSFSPRHLARCSHYQLMFYDELFDVICEGLDFLAGGFVSNR